MVGVLLAFWKEKYWGKEGKGLVHCDDGCPKSTPTMYLQNFKTYELEGKKYHGQMCSLPTSLCG